VIGQRTGSRDAIDKAHGVLEEALALAQRAGNRAIEAMILHQLGKHEVDFVGSYAYLRRDLSQEDTTKRAAAKPLFEKAAAVAIEAGYDMMRVRALGSLAMISYGKGDLTSSRLQAETSLALARDFGRKLEMHPLLLVVGCVAADQGDPDHAREVIAEAVELGVEFRHSWGGQISLVGCALALAHLAASAGRLEEAVMLDTVVTTWLTTQAAWPGSTPARWANHTPHINALLDQRVAARRTLGQAEVERAVAEGQALSLAEAVAEVLSAQALAFGERPPEAPGASGTAPPDGLTARELKVLRLVASGRSNREIADELVLSVRTVERHVTNLYAKIGARGKADATAYAIHQGLA
jgi:ATP/maltotriose-dependent transcriptional regulator MalT